MEHLQTEFFQMHEGMDFFHPNESEKTDVVYRTVNLYAEDERYIWFLSDAPHLMKTIRNCIYKSGT